MLLSGTNLMLAFPRQPFFFFITNLDTGDATRSGFIKGNLGEAGVMFAGLLWGFLHTLCGESMFWGFVTFVLI